ncbi:unnamed protein product [Camellia sinensis]
MIETEIDSKERAKKDSSQEEEAKWMSSNFNAFSISSQSFVPAIIIIWICQSIPGVHLTSEVDSASSSQSTAQSAHNDMGTWGGADVKEIPIQGTGPHDAFWRKLRMAAEKKVYEELSLAAASSILSSSQSSEEE